MTEGMTESQFTIIRQDLSGFRLEVNNRLDKLVTRDAFTDERTRVDALISGHGREIGELNKKLEAEATARAAERDQSLNAQLKTAQENERLRKQTNLQWVALVATVIFSPIFGAVIGAWVSSSFGH